MLNIRLPGSHCRSHHRSRGLQGTRLAATRVTRGAILFNNYVEYATVTYRLSLIHKFCLCASFPVLQCFAVLLITECLWVQFILKLQVKQLQFCGVLPH
ncbi:hypothetical protein BDR03DRAFT_564980 [Suillus americanus]|nr:hypothetical protein BDR03DRAFT_564980 [Suillus americanus]